MDDILYYLIIGAIYLLSRLFGKKKKQDFPENVEEYEEVEAQAPRPAKKPAPSFEDILKELAGDNIPDFSTQEKTKPLEPVREEAIRTKQPIDYQEHNIEAVGEDELIDIVPHKPVERKKPEFKRDSHFEVADESSEVGDDIQEMLSDYDGLQKAIVLKEVLDRKY